MAAIQLPNPIIRRTVDTDGLEKALRQSVDGEVRFDTGSRATYSTDASNYRQVPIGVVVPRSVESAAIALRLCARFDVPVFSRGGGTSLAGETCNDGVVIDWSKYCNQIESIDPDAMTAIVEPGVILDQLNTAAGAHGLMFGPLPATHSRCTFGGMIGNNSCGSSAQAYGKTADNVIRLEVMCYDGTRFWVGGESERGGLSVLAEDPDAEPRVREIYTALEALAEEYGDDIRAKFPDIPRRVSGYNLDDLLPERSPDLARMLTGSESTLVTILRAEIKLVPVVRAKSTVLIGYPDIASAADAVPLLLQHDPLILEGMDNTMISNERERGMHTEGLELFPDGASWLLVQLRGDTQEAATKRASELAQTLQSLDSPPPLRVVDDPKQQALIMAVREGGLGATARLEGGRAAWPGWEDAAVDPLRLGDYLRDFRELLDEFGYSGASLYGHFGHGCVHGRIPFDLTTLHGIRTFREFVDRAAHLVVAYGGSLSGEHGDGQARGALLPIMFGDRVMEAFQRTKAIFDPLGGMNPGKVVSAHDPAEHLRLGPDYAPMPVHNQHFAYPDDDGSFANATLRCVGVGACRSHEGGVMCPSYRATGEEQHSTRGRARLLAEMMRGPSTSLKDRWRSTEVRDALDLCLSCKGCKSDCPVDVDMATYKAEFLAHHYEHRLRPAAHYTMGWLPLWSRLVAFAPRIVNAATHAPGISRIIARVGGLDPDRPLPHFARRKFRRLFRKRREARMGSRGDVILWPDTFNDSFHPAVVEAAVTVLEDAGYRVRIPDAALCCGLTWISTGQLSVARRMLRKTAQALAPLLTGEVPLVVLEPSCAAVFRSDGPELVPDDPDIARLAQKTVTLAELLDQTPNWKAPSINLRAVVQPHCHQHAVLGFDADRHVLESAGVELEVISGCCGLAGNFGFEKGHLDVSMACAEIELLPAVRAADDRTVILADGFSCRTQVEQSGVGRGAVHLAELLAAAIRGELPPSRVEEHIAPRPAPPQALRRHAPTEQPFVTRARSN